MKVSIIMGSTSDYEVMHGAEQFLADFGIEYETPAPLIWQESQQDSHRCR